MIHALNTILFILFFGLVYFISSSSCSRGDNFPSYRSCVQRCRLKNCSGMILNTSYFLGNYIFDVFIRVYLQITIQDTHLPQKNIGSQKFFGIVTVIASTNVCGQRLICVYKLVSRYRNSVERYLYRTLIQIMQSIKLIIIFVPVAFHQVARHTRASFRPVFFLQSAQYIIHV